MVRKTKEEARETRERLLDAAETIFRVRGVTRTSLADGTDSVTVGLLTEAVWGATNVSGRVSSSRTGVSGAKPDPAGK